MFDVNNESSAAWQVCCAVVSVTLMFLAAPAYADQPPAAPPIEVGVQPAAPGTAPQASAGHETTPQERGRADGVEPPHHEHGSLGEVAAKLSDPTSNVWALFTQYGITTSDGDANLGGSQVGGNMSFQPIMPFPLYGKGKDEWKLIVRPTIPVEFGVPVPQGFNDFNHETGLGDILLPLVVSPPVGNWLLGLGPTFTIPTSTRDAFGRQQWAVGPAGVIGYKTKKWVAVAFPQYFFGIGSRGDQGSKPDASYMALLYSVFYNLPDAWQVGFNPTITYDNQAGSGNQWNVPIGLDVAKTVAIRGRPWKFQFGIEYSVVSQETFGQEFQVKLNVIPVIDALVHKPLFGGD